MSETSSRSSSDFAAPPDAHRLLALPVRQRARTATMALFFIAGMMYASWGTGRTDRLTLYIHYESMEQIEILSDLC